MYLVKLLNILSTQEGAGEGLEQKEENRSHVRALHRWIFFARKSLLVYFFKRKNLECLEVTEHAVSIFHYTPCKRKKKPQKFLLLFFPRITAV